MPSSWRGRLDHASEHLKSIEHEVHKFIKTEPYRAIPQVDPQPIGTDEAEYFLTVYGEALREPPDRIPHLIGDFVGSLRSSLDHIAFELAGGDKAPSGTEFPIFYSPYDFLKRDGKGRPARGGGLYKMRGMDPAAQAVIEGMQPHAGVSPTQFGPGSIPPKVARHPLYVLHELRRIDFHRKPHFTGAVSGPGMLHFFSPAGGPAMTTFVDLITGATFGILNQKTVIARADWRSTYPPLPTMQVNLEFLFDVAFDPGGPGAGRSVYLLLAELRDHVRDVVFPQLEPLI